MPLFKDAGTLPASSMIGLCAEIRMRPVLRDRSCTHCFARLAMKIRRAFQWTIRGGEHEHAATSLIEPQVQDPRVDTSVPSGPSSPTCQPSRALYALDTELIKYFKLGPNGAFQQHVRQDDSQRILLATHVAYKQRQVEHKPRVDC